LHFTSHIRFQEKKRKESNEEKTKKEREEKKRREITEALCTWLQPPREPLSLVKKQKKKKSFGGV
jgi:hypothetical protein